MENFKRTSLEDINGNDTLQEKNDILGRMGKNILSKNISDILYYQARLEATTKLIKSLNMDIKNHKPISEDQKYYEFTSFFQELEDTDIFNSDRTQYEYLSYYNTKFRKRFLQEQIMRVISDISSSESKVNKSTESALKDFLKEYINIDTKTDWSDFEKMFDNDEEIILLEEYIVQLNK